MRSLLVLILFSSLPVLATSPAYEIKAKNPDCQLELEALEKKYISELEVMYPDFEINVLINKLMAVRSTSLIEGAIETQRTIDSLIANQLIETGKYKITGKAFLEDFARIKNALSVAPLLVSDAKKEELEKVYLSLGI
jgi:hypothetical protein